VTKLILVIFVLLLIAAPCPAQSNSTAWVQLAWDPSPNSYVGTNADGSNYTNYWAITNYAVYCGTVSGTYTNINKVMAGTNLTASVSNLVRGATYYFAATATDTNGLESLYSTEVSCKIPPPRPPPPTVLRVITGN
jgi:hypothetical protein